MTLGGLLAALGRRGLGATLIPPCLLIILPTGLVPGVPAVMAVVMIYIAGHMAIGRQVLWLPPRLRAIGLPTARLRDGLVRFRPWADRFDRWTESRFIWFAKSRFAAGTVAVVTVVLSLLIIVIGVIPGVPAALCLAILFFAVGLAVENGLVILLGYAVTVIMGGLVWLWVV